MKKNIWKGNYWNETRLLPKPIVGRIVFIFSLFFYAIPIPWIQFDWHPAKEPYDIDV